MFIGHFAVAFAAKRAAPAASLGTLFIACELVDLAWPVFLLIGLEAVAIRPGATAFTPLDFVHYPWTHSLVMTGAWAAGLGLLYFVLRRNSRAALVIGAVVLSHWFGLGLWNSVAATAGLLVFLLAAYAGAAFGPPPPSVAAVAWAGLVGGALAVLLGYWVDRHRVMEA